MSENVNEEIQIAGKPQESPMQSIENVLHDFLAAASPESVYQKPIKHGDSIIIPTSELFSVLGFGLGSGSEGGDKGQDSNGGEGGGGGGGGSVHTRPVAVIVSTPDGVRVEPVFDLTKIVVTALATGVMVFGAIARMASMRQKVEEFQDEMMKMG